MAVYPATIVTGLAEKVPAWGNSTGSARGFMTSMTSGATGHGAHRKAAPDHLSQGRQVRLDVKPRLGSAVSPTER